MYKTLNEHYKEKFGCKVYKLSIDAGFTCPNRDGTLGNRGCIFCSEVGAGFELQPSTVDISEQIRTNMAYIRKKYNANRFLIYFQNFTATYLPLETFRQYLFQAVSADDIVGVVISTRPDCLDGGHLDLLDEVKEKGLDVFLELGLQSANDTTLEKINRGHTVSDYIRGAKLVKEHGFYLDTHLILNLPWDSEDDIVAAAKLVNEAGCDSVKLHSLHIPYGTKLYDLYQAGEIAVISKEEYFHRLYLFLKELNPVIAVQRLFSRAPKEDTAFCNWQTSWWKLEEEFLAYTQKMSQES